MVQIETSPLLGEIEKIITAADLFLKNEMRLVSPYADENLLPGERGGDWHFPTIDDDPDIDLGSNRVCAQFEASQLVGSLVISEGASGRVNAKVKGAQLIMDIKQVVPQFKGYLAAHWGITNCYGVFLPGSLDFAVFTPMPESGSYQEQTPAEAWIVRVTSDVVIKFMYPKRLQEQLSIANMGVGYGKKI